MHYKGKKLCGILTESVFGKENYIIVGIGVNINQDKLPKEIENIAVSLKIIKKKRFDITKLMKNIIDEFFYLCKNYYNESKFGTILKIWRRYSDTLNKNVVAITRKEKIYGKVIDIDKNGNLLLKLKNDKIIKIIEGDINIRY